MMWILPSVALGDHETGWSSTIGCLSFYDTVDLLSGQDCDSRSDVVKWPKKGNRRVGTIKCPTSNHIVARVSPTRQTR